MAAGDRERWNARYGEEGGTLLSPSAFLVGLDSVLPRRGRALDVAGGPGRNSLWLARRGLEVTLADVSDVALLLASSASREAAVPLCTVEVDLESAPLPPGPWDVIVCTYFLHRPLFSSFQSALSPGGWLVFAHATRRNLERHPRPGPRHVLEEGECRRLAQGLEVVELTEGWFEEGRHEARLVARKVAGRRARAGAADGAEKGPAASRTSTSA